MTLPSGGGALAATPRRIGPRDPGIWLPFLIVAGAAVSGYLTYVETTGATAACGPVGDCNTVQQSPYATLFGVIPIGLLGLVGYGLMLALWVLGLEGRPSSGTARRLLLAASFAGTVFSVYLTFLEPFVIGATCIWCLSSAAIVTALMWLSAPWLQNTSAQRLMGLAQARTRPPGLRGASGRARVRLVTRFPHWSRTNTAD